MSEGKTLSATADDQTLEPDDEAVSNSLLDIFGPAVVGPVVIILFIGSTPFSRLATFAVLHAVITIIFPFALWFTARRRSLGKSYVLAERAWLITNGVLNAALPWIIAPAPRWSHYALGLIFAAIAASDTLWIALRPYPIWKMVLGLTTVSYAAFLSLVEAWGVTIFCLAFCVHLMGGHDAVQELVHHLRREKNRSEMLALTDPLTGLRNRRGLNRYLNDARPTETMVVAALDIDDFKQINDRLGHHGGDAALIQLARHMTDKLGDRWLVARSGGDEFVCVSTNGSYAEAREALARVPSLLFEDTILPMRVSVGLAAGSPDHTLLADASAALRLSKKRGKHRFTEVDDKLRIELHEARRLGTQLAEAVQRRDIEIWGQPIVHLDDPTRIHSYECLARWATPDGTAVPPSTFIPMIEDQRLTRELGETVIDKAADFLADLDEEIAVSVNVSASHFTSHGFIEFLHSALARRSLDPSRLTIEITESEDISFEDQRSHGVARQLREMGVGLAIDDFGTGYASFERLVSFPFSQLKLDRSLVESATTSKIGMEHLLAGFGQLSRASGIEIVAEGVEDPSQRDLLATATIPYAQGYLFGRPKPIEEILQQRPTYSEPPTGSESFGSSMIPVSPEPASIIGAASGRETRSSQPFESFE